MAEKIFKTESYGKIYTLFGQEVKFSDAAERQYDLNRFMWTVKETAEKEFTEWYKNADDIESVLNKYQEFVTELLVSEVCTPLYKQLADSEIYDVSKNVYLNKCLVLENCQKAYADIAEKLEEIVLKQLGEEKARELRKEMRGRWVGGGFGLEGAIKGAVTAGALNLASGIGHSMINAVGNSLSAISASISKSRLYDDAKKKLLSGIQDDIGRIINKHTDLLNEYERDYVVYYFKSEKADALFENAKEMADKREGLLVQAVRYAPWYHALLSYIFVNYERERKTAAELARRFGVDLSNDIEAALKSGYESSPKESDDDLLKLKNKLRSLMLEYNVSSSQTMDDLDKALLKRFLERAQQNTVAQCNELKAAVEAYDARAEIKSQYLKDIEKRRDDIWESGLQAICSGYEEADETHLQELLPKIGDFDAPEEIKKVYADRVRKQIDKIRSEEDDEVFSKIYLSTDLKDSKAVRQAIDLIIAKQRTDASEPYLKALKACITDTAEIEKAISYLRGRKGFKYWSLFFCVLIFAAAGFFLIAIHFVGNRINWPTYFISWGILEWPTSYICGVSFILMYVSTSFAAALKSADNDKRDALRKLTINGKHLHPALRYVPGRAELKRIAEHAAAKNNDDNPGFDGCVVACGWLAWLLFLCWIVGSFVYSLIFK